MAETFSAVRIMDASPLVVARAVDTYDAATPGGAGMVWNASRTLAREEAAGSICEIALRQVSPGRTEVTLTMTPSPHDTASLRVLSTMGEEFLDSFLVRIEQIALRDLNAGDREL